MSLLFFARATVWVAVVLVLAVAAGIDLKRRIIPDELVALVAVGGMALAALSRPGTILPSLLFGVAVLLVLLVVAHFNVLGGGDAKLIAAATMLAPPDRVALLLLGIALAGGLISGIYLAAFHIMKRDRRYAEDSFVRVRFALAHRGGHARMRAGYSVPYAVAILGGVALYLASELYQCSSGISCSL